MKYNFIKDYNLLYELIKENRIFGRVKDKDGITDYITIHTLDKIIYCGYSGYTYFTVHDWSAEYCDGCETKKDVFIKLCEKYDLEFIKP